MVGKVSSRKSEKIISVDSVILRHQIIISQLHITPTLLEDGG